VRAGLGRTPSSRVHSERRGRRRVVLTRVRAPLGVGGHAFLRKMQLTPRFLS
jgi:hypothetical protein